MLSQTTTANSLDFASPAQLTNTLFDLGDCFGNLCRLPLKSALKIFQPLSQPQTNSSDHSEPAQKHHLFSQQLQTNIPFAVSREWKNQVWSYQLSLHTPHTGSDSHALHRHLSARSLTSIPTEQKDSVQDWLYFASPLDHLTRLHWQLLTAEELKQQRLLNLAFWLKQKLDQGSLINNLLLTPLTDLPLGDGLNLQPARSFARVGKQSLPDQRRLPSLHFAIFRQHRLTEGYGLQPSELFAAQEKLAAQSSVMASNQALLILDYRQCSELLELLEKALLLKKS
ncbi:hypothetical protein [Oceanospirillum linum]|uniref:Uncharacterized protein n=1 Tax=Oceanospirillum linum TaxID=966 RepID=A0A1T1HBD2_OCELI|nr:hypothetical protein [Oceanospirillum linum]OOV87037.1 hypothetical protein BTA35_0208475 [Oceanospirillum linum]SEF72357.1 hypothetical protein SAMN04489856_10292 [Oleiphilus messinensis]SMP16025.1 hypothetical protein SAMN06264348_10390 [Oceanospirillum linum]